MQFELGLKDGRLDGWNAGYIAGLTGEPYCDEVDVACFRRSRWWADGYREGYTCSYKEAYAAGCERRRELERHRCFEPYRPRWRHRG